MSAMERFTGRDGREWVKMPVDEYWARIAEAHASDASRARKEGWNDALDAAGASLEAAGFIDADDVPTVFAALRKPVGGAS